MREKEECVNVRRTTRVTLQTQGEKRRNIMGRRLTTMTTMTTTTTEKKNENKS